LQKAIIRMQMQVNKVARFEFQRVHRVGFL
jgi:hypothetical protein